MPKKKTLDVNSLVAGEESLPLCPKCGCAIITDFDTGEPLCNCTIAQEPVEAAAPEVVEPKEVSQAKPEPETDNVPSIHDLLAKIPGAPSQAEIDSAKAAYGKIYVSPFDEDEMYIWRPMRYREWQQIQMNQHLDNEQKMQEYVVSRAVIWPKLSPEMIAMSRAGTIPTLFQVITHGSNFLPIDMAVQLVREL